MQGPKTSRPTPARALLAALGVALALTGAPQVAQAAQAAGADPACSEGNADFSQSLVSAAIARESAAGGVSTYALPSGAQTLTPTEGHAHMLVVRVDFPDTPFADYEDAQTLQAMIGAGIEGVNDGAATRPISAAYPYESLSAYYDRSSYGGLHIEGNVVTYHAQHERDAYTNDIKSLFAELMEGLDATVDFTQYDADENGVIDGVYVIFAGERGDWGSTWWPTMYDVSRMYPELAARAFDGESLGCLTLSSAGNGATAQVATLIHETGHMLGLPDYYSYGSGSAGNDGILTDDMMYNNTGDHDAYSKWMLGWISDEDVTRVVVGADGIRIRRGTGEVELLQAPVELVVPSLTSELASTPGAFLAISADPALLGDGGLFSSFYLVQYDQPLGNQDYAQASYSRGLSSAFRVYRVQAELNEAGTGFAKTNAHGAAGDKFIECLDPSTLEGHAESYGYQLTLGDRITPATAPSTNFREMRSTGFTGIDLTVTSDGGGAGTVSVAYDGSLAPDPDAFWVADKGTGILSRGSYMLSCAYTPAINDSVAGNPRLWVDGREHNCDAQVVAGGILLTYELGPGELTAGSRCEVAFPEGYFLLGRLDGRDVTSGEMRVPLSVGPVAELASVGTYASTALSWGAGYSVGVSNVARAQDGNGYLVQAFVDWTTETRPLRLTRVLGQDPTSATTLEVTGARLAALSMGTTWELHLFVLDGEKNVGALVATSGSDACLLWIDLDTGEVLAQRWAYPYVGGKDWVQVGDAVAMTMTDVSQVTLAAYTLGDDGDVDLRFVTLVGGSLVVGDGCVGVYASGAVGYFDAQGAVGREVVGPSLAVLATSAVDELLAGGYATEGEALDNPVYASELAAVASLAIPGWDVVLGVASMDDAYYLLSMGYDTELGRQTYTVTSYDAEGGRLASAEVGGIEDQFVLGIPQLFCGQHGGVAVWFCEAAAAGVDAKSATVLLCGPDLARAGVLQHRGTGAGAWLGGRWASVGYALGWGRAEDQRLQYAVSVVLDGADEPEDPTEPTEPTDPDDPTDPGDPTDPRQPEGPAGPGASSGKDPKAVPQTSDASLPASICALLAVSGVGLAAVGRRCRQRSRG